MVSDSENESMEGDVDCGQQGAKEHGSSWGKAKFDYYFTDYVDKDYPSSLSRKEERLAQIEQEEAQRMQLKLFSKLDNVNLQPVIDYESDDSSQTEPRKEDLISQIENQNRSIINLKRSIAVAPKRRAAPKKNVKFDIDDIGGGESALGSDSDENDSGSSIEMNEDGIQDDEQKSSTRRRRPINMAIKKNRGLTPYKKKEFRNPRVKHKLKYKKAMTKRRRLVKEAQTEFYRYSGETTGIKTSTVRSIKLC